MIKNICKSVIISYLVSFALLLIGAIVMFYCHVTEKTVSALVIIIYFISNLIGGINAGRLAQSRKFVKGIMVGIIYFCVLFLICHEVILCQNRICPAIRLLQNKMCISFC